MRSHSEQCIHCRGSYIIKDLTSWNMHRGNKPDWLNLYRAMEKYILGRFTREKGRENVVPFLQKNYYYTYFVISWQSTLDQWKGWKEIVLRHTPHASSFNVNMSSNKSKERKRQFSNIGSSLSKKFQTEMGRASPQKFRCPEFR